MSELDDRLTDARAVVGTMHPPEELWGQVEERASHADAAVLDLAPAQHRQGRAVWLAVAAAVALLAVAGVLALQDEDDTTDTVPATGGETTTTEESIKIAFAAPFSFDLPDEWTVEEDRSFYRFAVGPEAGPPQTRIDFAIPDAAKPEAAVAEIRAQSPSIAAFGDPVDATVGNLPAVCMDVGHPDGNASASPLAQLRQADGEALEEDAVVLEEGAVGRVCVVDAPALPGRGRVPIIVLVQAPAAEFDAFLDEAEGMLDAAEF